MTETEIKKLKQAVLEHWKDTKSVVGDVVVGLSQQVSILRKELADEKKFLVMICLPQFPQLRQLKKMLGLLSLKPMTRRIGIMPA